MKKPLRRSRSPRPRPVSSPAAAPSPPRFAAALLAAGLAGVVVVAPAARAQGPDISSDTPATAPASPDRIVITGSPLDRSAFDLAQPVSSLSGLDLKAKKASTLGDTLNGEPGISTSGFTAGASRPIIRGQQDNRVRVLNNGTEVFDVSNLSPDHAPSVEPLISSSIEVVRGPATVLYGSGAIGGVVNVIDGRIPTALPDNGRFGGELIGRMGGVDLERSGAFSLDLAVTPHLILHADGTRFFTNDLKVPDRALSDRLRRDLSPDATALGNKFGGDTEGYVPNSYVRTKDFGLGASYVWDKGYVGAAFSQFLSVYGVPVDPGSVVNGPPPEVGSDAAPAEAPVPVRLDVTKRRGEFRFSVTDPFPFIRTVNGKVTYTDYKHLEIDGASEIGSTFKTNGVDSRLELVHIPFGRFEGSVGAQVFYKHLSVLGDDAFLQPTDTIQPAAFFFEEVRLLGGEDQRPAAAPDAKDHGSGKGAIAGGDSGAFHPSLRFQFGGRVEFNHVAIDSTDPLLTSIPIGRNGLDTREFVPLSASAGLVYEFAKDTNLALTFSYAERAPTAEELYARGVHDATFQYLIGNPDLGKEKQLGVDVSIRRRAGFVTGSLSGFYNRFYDFVDFNPTGEFIDDQRVFNYTAKNADFYGGEALADFHLLPASVSRPVATPDPKSVKSVVAKQGRETVANPNDLYLEIKGDYVHAEDRDSGESLPRITPLRFGGGLGFTNENFSAKVEGLRVNHQYRVAPFETATPGYTFLNASASYRLPLPGTNRGGALPPVTAEVFVRGTNLLDEQGRNHQSFLKDVLPLPGRNVLGGLRLTF